MNLSIYKALDDDTLAALANRGLLRRAQKDLEREAPQVRVMSDVEIVLDFIGEGCQVTLPAGGPQHARCTCPADGVCRHILTGVLFLRLFAENQEPRIENYPEGTRLRPENHASALSDESNSKLKTTPVTAAKGQNSSCSDEILAIDEASLVAWATRAVYRQALDDLAGDPELEIEERDQLILLRLPQLNVVVRWVAGAGLAGMICSCKRAGSCRHRVAAVLRYQADHGQSLPALERAALGGAAGAPRSRDEVLAAVKDTLIEIAALGFVRLARANEERLRTLAISAHGVDLPRLERNLRALGDQLTWYLGRDVRAAASDLLISAARTYALVHALHCAEGPPPTALVGEHRSRYYDVGALDLVGLGAQQWRTRSGYAGLTVFFWDLAARRWVTWSDSRPAYYANVQFDPAQRYRSEGAWPDAPAPATISRSQVQLGRARRNRDGRLSAYGGTQALVAGPSAPEALDLAGVRFDDWAALAQHLAAAYASGLAEHRLLDRLVVVVPARWGESMYDQQRQVLVRPVYDAHGRALALALSYRAEWAFAVELLQGWEPQRRGTWGMLGYGQLGAGGLEFAPVTLFNRTALPAPIDSPIINLTLDRWQPALVAAPVAPVPTVALANSVMDEGTAALPDDDPELAAAASSAVGRLVGAALALLEQVAEQGGAARSDTEAQLCDLAARLRQVGMTVCADQLAHLAKHLAANRHTAAPDSRRSAHVLLLCAYVLQLAREQVAVTTVLSTLQPSHT